jgi:hypothetical protein
MKYDTGHEVSFICRRRAIPMILSISLQAILAAIKAQVRFFTKIKLVLEVNRLKTVAPMTCGVDQTLRDKLHQPNTNH